MGLFDKFKKKEAVMVNTEPGKLYAPITGKYISIDKIPDEVFSQGILGPGCGIEPIEGKVVSPINGTISTVADTKHAVGLTTEDGAELLIHVGMDTVEMNGNGFSVMVKQGDKVTCGQTLLRFDIDEIKKAGHPTTTAFVLVNSDEFPAFHIVIDKQYQVTEEIGFIRK